MIRSNLQLPRTPTVGAMICAEVKACQTATPRLVQMASTLDYDGATHQLTLTRGDGTVQQFPAANNAQRRSGG